MYAENMGANVLELTRRRREIISRTAAAAMAIVLFIGGGRCMQVVAASANQTVGDARRSRVDSDLDRHDESNAKASIANVAGLTLFFVGGVVALYACTPLRFFQRLMGSPGNTTLWRRSELGDWLK